MIEENVLKNPSDEELAAAVHDNLYALFHSMQAIPGCELVENAHLSLHHTPFTGPFFRGVWRVRLSSAEVQTQIDEVINWFRQHQPPDFFWWSDTHTQPGDLGEYLMQRGFNSILEGDPGMVANLHELAEDRQTSGKFTIRSATEPTSLADWRSAFVEAYETDIAVGQALVEATLAVKSSNVPWRLYVGYLDGYPVGTSILFNGAGVAGIYAVGTIPQVRHQGIGAKMTLLPLLDARKQGYNYGVLFSSRMGYSVYQRLGFREVPCKIGLYFWERE